METDSAKRKEIPVASGFVDYFPLAMAAVAALSKAGNDKHNPDEPLHWSKEKSGDHDDCLMRHFLERDKYDYDDGFLHAVKVAWRAMAALETVLETGKEYRIDIVKPPVEINCSTCKYFDLYSYDFPCSLCCAAGGALPDGRVVYDLWEAQS